MNAILETIGNQGLVPVVKLAQSQDALPLGAALEAGGISLLEITFRSSAASEAIQLLREKSPHLLVGAGTVVTFQQLEQALAAKAQFIVSPCFDEEIIDACQAAGVPVIPGISNADGVAKALKKGLEVVKFFPAEASGGIPLLDSLAGPFESMKFIPTGGIDEANLASYAGKKQVHAIGGSWMVKPELINGGYWDRITQISRQAIHAMHGFHLAHVGINSQNPDQASQTAGLLGELFGFAIAKAENSVFVGASPSVEIMNSRLLGEHGHLAIGVRNVERAAWYLAKHGIKTKPETAQRQGNTLSSIYLDLELNGFALHLVRV